MEWHLKEIKEGLFDILKSSYTFKELDDLGVAEIIRNNWTVIFSRTGVNKYLLQAVRRFNSEIKFNLKWTDRPLRCLWSHKEFVEPSFQF